MFCKSILIIEDDEDIRSLMAEALTMEEHTVYQAGNGQEALDFLLSLPEDKLPGCIILDYMMPIMNGLVFMETVEKYHKAKLGGIHIILASAAASLQSSNSIFKGVARISKPFELDELYGAVEKYCGVN